MPFSLRSDDELIAEARRALEALGVDVVLDRSSSSLDECIESNQLAGPIRKSAILTSRAAVNQFTSRGFEACAALLGAFLPLPGAAFRATFQYTTLGRSREMVDVAAAASAWWRKVCADPTWRHGDTFICGTCHEHVPLAQEVPACPQCHADICKPCTQRLAGGTQVLRCPDCDTWYLEELPAWGVPWDMPRPAPTRRPAPAPSSALPRRMAAAVGPDGWLRLPPRHQRMHPVDVLVDGVLSVLDGQLTIEPTVTGSPPKPEDVPLFLRLPLSDRLHFQSSALEAVRRQLRQVSLWCSRSQRGRHRRPMGARGVSSASRLLPALSILQAVDRLIEQEVADADLFKEVWVRVRAAGQAGRGCGCVGGRAAPPAGRAREQQPATASACQRWLHQM